MTTTKRGAAPLLAVGALVLSGALIYVATTATGSASAANRQRASQSQSQGQSRARVAAAANVSATDTPVATATATTAPAPTATLPPPPPAPPALTISCASAFPQAQETMGWLLDLCLRGPAGAQLVVMLTICPAAVAPATPTIMSVSPVTLDASGAWQSMNTYVAGIVINAPCAPPFTIAVDASGSDAQGDTLSASASVNAG